jgi:hypothetical protein
MDLPEHGALLLLILQLLERRRHYTNNTDVHCCCTDLLWSNTCCITDNIEQWYHRYMVSGHLITRPLPTYTFTPAAGQCATTTTLTITVNPQATPTFTQIGPLCQNSTAPALPGTSSNGFAGTWSPAVINTTTLGTTTYTFTPTDPCAAVTKMDIVISAQVTPTFAQIGPLCQNSTAPALPGTSSMDLPEHGVHQPSTASTLGTTTYTFTPTNPCAAVTKMDIVISTQITPTFTAVAPVCSGATLAALPTTSNNGITGTWSPALNNTATTTYTFTPAAGQCATTTTLTITVNPQATPTFTQIGPLCQNSTAPALPGTSSNGFAGTWSPAVINTTALGTTTYTFTPTDPCAKIATMDIVISAQVTPTFTQIGPLCQNSTAPALPGTSSNGFAGTWSPSTINTANVGTTTYTFTPTDPCSKVTTMDIVISTQVNANVHADRTSVSK